MNKRPVYIFSGESCLCKSHIAALTGKTVFETDSVSELPDIIKTDIVVLGRRNKHWTVEDVKQRIFNIDNCKVIIVKFEEDS